MPKIVITADLHFDPSGSLTPPSAVEKLVRRIERERPDAVVLAGDLGHPLASFRACLRAFRGLQVPVGVLAGNHDVWHD